jgi:hypothetical protein
MMTQSIQSNPRYNADRVRDAEFNPDTDSYEDPDLERERAAERERAEARDAARDRAEDEATPVGAARDQGSFGTSYLGEHSTEDSWQEWRVIQADFVDNPREAVSKANRLVGELIDSIVRQFNTERNQLEQRWSSGEDVSTEDLRKSLQTYRDFFGRLLSKVDAKN